MLIDAHCHLTDPIYEESGGVLSVLESAREAGVGAFVCAGFDMDSSRRAAALAEKYPDVFFCAGYQPEELAKYREGDLSELFALCADKKCVAVGEIGLDYHFENNPEKAFQKELFVRQLELADRAGLPVVVHSRDAAADTLDILSQNKSLLKKGGVLHCYSYSAEMIPAFAALGLYFSFGGTSTFKNAKKTRECLQRTPAPLVLTETDCPYLTPEPFRGSFPNRPENVKYVLKNAAFLRGVKENEMEETVEANARRLFFRLENFL